MTLHRPLVVFRAPACIAREAATRPVVTFAHNRHGADHREELHENVHALTIGTPMTAASEQRPNA